MISFGGNALKREGEKGNSIISQREAISQAAKVALEIIDQNRERGILITHGNGPQSGDGALRHIAGIERYGVPDLPLDCIVTETQGLIGYLLQGEINRQAPLLLEANLLSIATLITEVEVDKDDPAFLSRSKPIGGWLLPEEADELRQRFRDWEIADLGEEAPDLQRPFRRVVASPEPLDILNIDAIRALLSARILTIAAGGGGIPMYMTNKQRFPAEAVIDKDRTTALLAEMVGASEMAIFTAVPGVMEPEEFQRFRSTGEARIEREISLTRAQELLEMLPKGNGSIRPKLNACLRFSKRTGNPSIITDFSNARAAVVERSAGTRIVP